MTIVLVSLILGLILGRLVNRRVLKANDYVFMALSTVFVFIMGTSLGLSRSTFSDVGNTLVGSVVLALVASLGSIVVTKITVGLFFNSKND